MEEDKAEPAGVAAEPKTTVGVSGDAEEPTAEDVAEVDIKAVEDAVVEQIVDTLTRDMEVVTEEAPKAAPVDEDMKVAFRGQVDTVVEAKGARAHTQAQERAMVAQRIYPYQIPADQAPFQAQSQTKVSQTAHAAETDQDQAQVQSRAQYRSRSLAEAQAYAQSQAQGAPTDHTVELKSTPAGNSAAVPKDTAHQEEASQREAVPAADANAEAEAEAKSELITAQADADQPKAAEATPRDGVAAPQTLTWAPTTETKWYPNELMKPNQRWSLRELRPLSPLMYALPPYPPPRKPCSVYDDATSATERDSLPATATTSVQESTAETAGEPNAEARRREVQAETSCVRASALTFTFCHTPFKVRHTHVSFLTECCHQESVIINAHIYHSTTRASSSRSSRDLRWLPLSRNLSQSETPQTYNGNCEDTNKGDPSWAAKRQKHHGAVTLSHTTKEGGAKDDGQALLSSPPLLRQPGHTILFRASTASQAEPLNLQVPITTARSHNGCDEPRQHEDRSDNRSKTVPTASIRFTPTPVRATGARFY